MRYFRAVRVYATIEAMIFTALLVVWIGGLSDHAKEVLGWVHGFGWLILCGLVARGCVATSEAGHRWDSGPWSASRTASAFRRSGTQQMRFLALIRVGQVRVMASLGTASRFGKCPSPTCCRRHLLSKATRFTTNGS